VRAAARFHHHARRLQSGEEIAELGSTDLLAPDLACLVVDSEAESHLIAAEVCAARG
jgi:hypothetical protein